MSNPQRFFIAGPPGVGKSRIMEQMSDHLGISMVDLSVEHFDESEELKTADFARCVRKSTR